MADQVNWEFGSFFPLIEPPIAPPIAPSIAPVMPSNGPRGYPRVLPLPGDPLLFGTGRQALTALLDMGRRQWGWARVHLPAYYCPDVVTAVRRLLPVVTYDAGPMGGEDPVAGADDVVIAVSYFGAPAALPADTPATVVIDASHDPFAQWPHQDPRADFVFASLRKALPVPDGGALWACGDRVLPPAIPATAEHMATVGTFLSAMVLKAAYLGGAAVDKERYLALYATGERRCATTAVSGISEVARHLLTATPVEEWLGRRQGNGVALAAGVDALDGLVVHRYPLGVVLECDTPARRESLRLGLIERAVYPAVLWRLPDDSPRRQVDFSRRMLFLHTDFRWDIGDMDRVASTVREIHQKSYISPVGTSSRA